MGAVTGGGDASGGGRDGGGMRARIKWDLLETQWSPQVPRPTRKGESKFLLVPPPVHWRFNERMIHDLGGGIAVQATLVQIELEG